MIECFVLSHGLRPLSHADATMGQLDTPDYILIKPIVVIAWLLDVIIYLYC